MEEIGIWRTAAALLRLHADAARFMLRNVLMRSTSKET
jgi:hypothetical protein